MRTRRRPTPSSYEALLRGYYGAPPTLEARVSGDPAVARVVTLSRDDGELLSSAGGSGADEYVVPAPPAPPAAVPPAAADATSPSPPRPEPAPAPGGIAPPGGGGAAPVAAAPLSVDPGATPPAGVGGVPGAFADPGVGPYPGPTFDPGAAAGPQPGAGPYPGPAAAPVPDATAGAATPPAPSAGLDPRAPAAPPASPAPLAPSGPGARGFAVPPGPAFGGAAISPAEAGAASVDEHELAADIQAILSGAKVYDPATNRTVERDQLGVPAPPPAPAATPEPPVAPAATEQSIFDRIAASMEYANAYDLGTVELDNRFADFDRMDDLAGRRRPEPTPSPGPAPVGTADFLQDIDAIRAGTAASGDNALRIAASAIAGGIAHATCLSSSIALAASAPPALSRPFYDTGEHALAAEGLYPTPLLVGQAPGVAFSYAQLVTMGDLYAGVTELLGAPVAELTALKTLIERSTEHYRHHDGPDVSDHDWQVATGGRYLRLAAENFTHFAPNTLLARDPVAAAGVHHGDHREAWQTHHAAALAEARRGTGPAPAHAMIVNAFGDHFLTDAFASGHLVNKDAVANLFKHGFLSGGKLTSAGDAFFDRVAARAFVGDVARKFSALETAHWPHWYVPFHPNINSTDRFATLLKAACEAKPDKLANMAVKAIHDRLNVDGIQVSNAAGDAPWRLTGDGQMTEENRLRMQGAVRQSIANVSDPALRATGDAACFERVWRQVPVLTPASETTVRGLIGEYTNPASTLGSDTAAALITDQVDQLIAVLVEDEHQLRPA